MKLSTKTYQFIKTTHLFASLTTVVFLSMYLASSFMMVHHDTFKSKEVSRHQETISITPEIVEGKNWENFLKKHSVHGRLENEWTSQQGELVRRYEAPEVHFKFTINADKQSLTLETFKWNFNATMNELHRLRYYKGPLTFWLYAFMVDITAIALIIFVITGIVLWLRILKDKWIGWLMLILGACYVGLVMFYMM